MDANGGLTPEMALRIFRLLPKGLDFVLEAPCKTWRETKSLRQRCDIPFSLDELIQQDEDLIHAITEDLIDGVGLKSPKLGINSFTPTS